jgi:drug/metabolite transporter (DMT)-like permease
MQTKKSYSMFQLVAFSILSGLFFSTTFILNESMSLGGGHWVWSASLRYGFMILFLILILWIKGGIALVAGALRLFGNFWKFWIFAGSIGFGGFYALMCFTADIAPGWIIASTWQFTVVASLFILLLFGQRFPKRVWGFSSMVFIGVVLVNLSRVGSVEFDVLLLGALPMVVAAFCYPLGNQLIWEAMRGQNRRLPHIKSTLLHNSFVKVLMMSLGSLPLWVLLVFLFEPPFPSASQFTQTAMVALFSGVIATSIFLFARTHANSSSELAGVDASQSSQVLFALIGGILFLDASMPAPLAFVGLGFIGLGLGGFLFFRQKLA